VDGASQAQLPGLTYVVDGPDMLRLRGQWSRATRGAYGQYGVVISGALFAIHTAATLSNPHTRAWAIDALVLVFAAMSSVLGIRLWRLIRGSTAYELRLNWDAIELTRNGQVEIVPWSWIGDAYALRDGYALARRDDRRHPIFVPKRVFADGGASLWTFLERRLTGTLPSIRELGFPAPAHIKNTLEQSILSLRDGRAWAAH
jgi:hypothetical protein